MVMKMKTTNSIRFFAILLIIAVILSSFFLKGSGESARDTNETPQMKGQTEQIAEADTQTEAEPVWNMHMPENTTSYLIIEKDLYLSVYSATGSEKIFDTGILVSGLDMELQEKVKEGIPFSSIEEVYDFLENCSS